MTQIKLQTEPIGSIPRPRELLEAIHHHDAGKLQKADLDGYYERALRDTIRKFEGTGSAVITDGEQTKPSFVTYPIAGPTNLTPNGVVIPFADGHTRQLPALTTGPFRYVHHAVKFYNQARKHTRIPL